jgi:hypothetical protein
MLAFRVFYRSPISGALSIGRCNASHEFVQVTPTTSLVAFVGSCAEIQHSIATIERGRNRRRTAETRRALPALAWALAGKAGFVIGRHVTIEVGAGRLMIEQVD